MIACLFRITALCAACLGTLAPVDAAGATLDAAARARVLEGVIAKLHALYLFPEKARAMEKALRERMARREYDGVAGAEALAGRLTRDLRAVVDDRHLSVQYSARRLPPQTAAGIEPPAGEIAALRREFARRNYGIARVEILPGNLGYIDIQTLFDVAYAGPVWDAAMRFVADADALLVDLRRCPGAVGPGSEKMINWICGYFLERPAHVCTIRWRPQNRIQEQWSPATVPGPRFLGKPVYLLTGRSTFSGAEALAYILKNRKCVTTVGERTGGGAHGGGSVPIDDHFSVWMPMGQVIDPLTGTDWEGVGIAPDIAVPAADALLAARRDALKRRLDAAPAARAFLAPALQEAEDELAAARRERARAPRVVFRLNGFAAAREVALAGEFNGWGRTAMTRTKRGWQASLRLAPGRYAYKFVVEGNWIRDPGNRRTVRDAGGNENSLVEVPRR